MESNCWTALAQVTVTSGRYRSPMEPLSRLFVGPLPPDVIDALRSDNPDALVSPTPSETLLHAAALLRATRCCRSLLSLHNASLQLQQRVHGWTPISVAAFVGCNDTLAALGVSGGVIGAVGLNGAGRSVSLRAPLAAVNEYRPTKSHPPLIRAWELHATPSILSLTRATPAFVLAELTVASASGVVAMDTLQHLADGSYSVQLDAFDFVISVQVLDRVTRKAVGFAVAPSAMMAPAAASAGVAAGADAALDTLAGELLLPICSGTAVLPTGDLVSLRFMLVRKYCQAHRPSPDTVSSAATVDTATPAVNFSSIAPVDSWVALVAARNHDVWGHRGSGSEGNAVVVEPESTDVDACMVTRRRTHVQENSLLSFAEGWRAGASFVELDVHLTRDAVPVVHHDFGVIVRAAGAANVRVPVGHLTAAQFLALDPQPAAGVGAAPDEFEAAADAKRTGDSGDAGGPHRFVTRVRRSISLGAQVPRQAATSETSFSSCRIRDRFCTLREVMMSIPRGHGVNIEVRRYL